MTGGVAVILGETGRNFAAGMSGGVVYVLDRGHTLYTRLNKAGLIMTAMTPGNEAQALRELIEAHAAETGSEKAKEILNHFDEYIPAFKKIIPKDYARMVESIAALESAGMPREDAEIEAFFAATRR